ncbi:hypothetical protein FQN54_005312 [Arachnomyces sp. PD_36]|nr:hypothetical protein FQN54_005312 [Arachnomyces sp. PD_36]
MPLSAPLLGASAALLFAIGISELALTVRGLNSTRSYYNIGTSNLRGTLRGHDVSLLPENYDQKPTKVTLAAGVIAAVTGLVGLFDVVFGLSEKATSKASYAAMIHGVLGLLSFILSLVALIYGMVAQSQSSTWHYEGIKTTYGKYTVEGWACQMKDVFVSYGDKFAGVCKESQAARYLTIVLFLFSIGFVAGAFLKDKSRKANLQRSVRKHQTEDELQSF